MIASAIATIVSGLAIFVAPGAFVLAAARVRLSRGERLAYAFAASLALLTAAFAACLALGRSIDAAPVAIAAVTALTALALRRFAPAAPPPVSRDASTTAPRAATIALLALTIGAIVAAVAFAPLGSVDRWWYLAYVRSWLDAPALTLAEPFLGTGRSFARFGVHPWLFGLALWSRMSGVDPVAIYERCAPVLVVLASISAARALAVELFGDDRRARLCVIATILLWSGSAVPVLARAGEDKVLAAAALLPLCFAAFLRILDRREKADWPLLAVAAVATAAVHALAYAFVLVVLLPAAALLAFRHADRRGKIAASSALLLLIAIAPAVSGFVVRERLDEIGAELSATDHPVVRVHEGRNRLITLPAVGYVVSPRLLVHPLLLLALIGVPIALRRRDRAVTAAIADAPHIYLLVATCVPFALAFVPPLPALAGQVIPPWMVYRVLWLLPGAALAALAADSLAKRFSRGEVTAIVLLLALGVPVVAVGARNRLEETRARVRAPDSADFRSLVEAVRALPRDALVVAAPELSERLPALAARPVVAGLDRSTIVFSGSRERGEARLRARAALLAGDEDAFALAAAAGVAPTHAIFDPRQRAAVPRCRSALFGNDSYSLCELDAALEPAASPAALPQTVDEEGVAIVVRGDCQPKPRSRRSPWSAAAPVADCSLTFPPGTPDRAYAVLRIEVVTGRAADELRIEVRGLNGSRLGRTTVRHTGKDAIVLVLPPVDAIRDNVLGVRIESSFLAFVKPVRVELEITGGEMVR